MVEDVLPAISWILVDGSDIEIAGVEGLDGCPPQTEGTEQIEEICHRKSGTIVACDEEDLDPPFQKGNSYFEPSEGGKGRSICGPRSSCQNTDIVVQRGNTVSSVDGKRVLGQRKTVKMAQCLCLTGASRQSCIAKLCVCACIPPPAATATTRAPYSHTAAQRCVHIRLQARPRPFQRVVSLTASHV